MYSLGDHSGLVLGDFGQLQPGFVDVLLGRTSDVKSSLSDLGRRAYQSFNSVQAMC